MKLVRIHRTVTPEPLDGYIIAQGRTWLLARPIDDSADIDGYTLLRNTHVKKVKKQRGTFTRRLLEMRHQWPPAGPDFPVDLDSTRRLMAELSDQGLPVSVFIEKEDPDVLFLGLPSVHGPKALKLREIDAAGDWHAEPSYWKHRRITRIDFGTRYTITMLEVAHHVHPDPAAPAPA
jgi:hypothetical protein